MNALEDYKKLLLFNQSCYFENDAPTSLSSSDQSTAVSLLGKTFSSEVKTGICEERKAAIKCIELSPFTEIGKLAANARKRKREMEAAENDDEAEEGEYKKPKKTTPPNMVHLDRAMMEIETTERVQGHENIVRLLGVFRSKEDDVMYFAFERMYGDLGRIIEKRRHFLWALALDPKNAPYLKIPWEDSNENGVILLRSVFLKILKGLAHIHITHGRVHGDLKPANILVGTENVAVSSRKNVSLRNAPIKLCDFSNSLPLEQSSTEYYTPEYKPPESFVDEVCDVQAADVWAFGVTLAEMFLCQIAIFKGAGIKRDATGKPDQYPSEEYRQKYIKYRDDTIEPWLRDYLLTQPPDPTNIPISRHFYDLVVNKCLAVDPIKRATCQELLNHPYFTVSFGLSPSFSFSSSHSPKTPPIDLLFTTLSSPERKLLALQKQRSPLGIKQTGF